MIFKEYGNIIKDSVKECMTFFSRPRKPKIRHLKNPDRWLLKVILRPTSKLGLFFKISHTFLNFKKVFRIKTLGKRQSFFFKFLLTYSITKFNKTINFRCNFLLKSFFRILLRKVKSENCSNPYITSLQPNS